MTIVPALFAALASRPPSDMEWLGIILTMTVLIVAVLLVSRLVDGGRLAEADRFRVDPQIGDRASYVVHISSTRRRWMVGTVTDVHRDEIGLRVELTVPYVTSFGSADVSEWWAIEHLTYEPADTELGPHEADA